MFTHKRIFVERIYLWALVQLHSVT